MKKISKLEEIERKKVKKVEGMCASVKMEF